ncbi:MAG: N-acetylmuramoyl-L-alanine amidase [Lewinellaceae bacterium]|nr:N-acetylmuramoyl-L-alanine amidase [Lewinellaceae bacterium]
MVYPGREGLGGFLIDSSQCLIYIAQDSLSGQDSIVLEWTNGHGGRLVVNYIANILADIDTTITDSTRLDSTIADYHFDPITPLYNHDPLAFAMQPPPPWQQFLADNFWWLKWGGLLLFTALLLAVLFYRAYRRRKLVAELESSDKPPYAWNIRIDGAEAVHLGDDFSYLLNLIRQRTGSEAFRLDVPKTINATIEQGGMPTFRFLQQTKPPEYLLLIGQQTPRNHRARLLDMLFRVLHENEVLIERFFYDNDPRICYNETHPQGIPLQEVQQRYNSSRLIVVGYGNALLNKLTGKPEPWSRLLLNWKHRLLLTPRPTGQWGKRERRLSGLFTLLPLSMQSLLFWLEELEMEEDARFDTWPGRVKDVPLEPIQLKGNLMDSLQEHFSEPMLQWIAACAVYPSLHWDLTLYLGQQLSAGKENLLTVDNLLQLTCLPWFTEGRIPPAARLSLIEWMEAAHPALLEQIRTRLVDILQENPPPADSAAFEDYRMNVALNEWLTTRDQRHRRELQQEISRRLEAGADADITVIKQLQRERHPLDFILSDNLKKYFRPHGLPGLGWRGEWRDVMRWALPLWIPALVLTIFVKPWLIEPASCGGIAVRYQLGEESHLLCLDSPEAFGTIVEAHIQAAIESDTLPGASAFNGQAMLWQSQAGAPLNLPVAAHSENASWEWKKASLSASSFGGFITYNSNDDSLQLRRTAGDNRLELSENWKKEYRSNIALAFYNQGVEILQEYDPGQIPQAGRDLICRYFQNAILLDSTQLDMYEIRNWCAGEATADTTASDGGMAGQELQKILVQAAGRWDKLQKEADLSGGASETVIPELGVRGRYAILKPLLNPVVLERLFGEPVYRAGPHQGADIAYRSEESFGRYNPAFLRKLYTTLNTLSKSGLLVRQVQGLYDREFRRLMQVFYQAYEVGAGREDIQKEYLSRLNAPASRLAQRGYTNFFEEKFGDLSIASRYYDPEAIMAAGFWVRRSIDGTADEFFQLLQLTLQTFDPAFLAQQKKMKPAVSQSLKKLPSFRTNGKLERVDIQQTVAKTHTPRYLWCLDNPHGSDTPGKRSPVFDDGKTQLFEYQLSRDVVDRIIRRLEEIGVEFYRVVPEEEDISLEERARRINNYNTRLPKLAVSVHFNAAPPEEGSSGWAKESVKGAEAWHYSGSGDGRRLGAVFLEKVIRKTGLYNRFVRSMEGRTEFYLLRNTKPPVTQVENGYYNNRADAALLAQPAFRQRLADAYVEAIQAIEVRGLDDTPAPLIDENDSDGDGVPNSEDGCPFTRGPAENKGCPVEEQKEYEAPPQQQQAPPQQQQGKVQEFPKIGEFRAGNRAYRTLQFEAGGPAWLGENLDIEVEDSWCYYSDLVNCERYGRLYSWKAAQKACQQLGGGWRLPSDEDWKALAMHFGGYYDWMEGKDYGDPEQAYQSLLKGGYSDFNARLGGRRVSTGSSFYDLGVSGRYWTSTAMSLENAWYYAFGGGIGKLYRNESDKSYGHSCRCLKD